MKHLQTIAFRGLCLLLLPVLASAQNLIVPDGTVHPGPKLTARTYNSGFALGHDSYNGMGTGSDGRIYYVLSSENIDQGAKMFCLDPRLGQITELGDLTEACGEKGSQGDSSGQEPRELRRGGRQALLRHPRRRLQHRRRQGNDGRSPARLSILPRRPSAGLRPEAAPLRGLWRGAQAAKVSSPSPWTRAADACLH